MREVGGSRRSEPRSLHQTRESGDAHAGRGYALVLLGREPEGGEAAEQAVRCAPREPDMIYNAACVYAQAAGRAATDRRAGDNPPAASRYDARGLELLRAALELKPPGDRASFWRDVVARDAALDPLRRLEGFDRLRIEFGGPSR